MIKSKQISLYYEGCNTPLKKLRKIFLKVKFGNRFYIDVTKTSLASFWDLFYSLQTLWNSTLGCQSLRRESQLLGLWYQKVYSEPCRASKIKLFAFSRFLDFFDRVLNKPLISILFLQDFDQKTADCWSTSQTLKFFIMDFFSNCEQRERKLQLCSYLLKKVLNVKLNFLAISFYAVACRM